MQRVSSQVGVCMFFYDCHKRVFCQQWKVKGFFFCWVYEMVFYGMVWKAYGKQDVQQGASYYYDLLLAPDLTPNGPFYFTNTIDN